MPTQLVTRQIADQAITFGKIQNITTARLLGRATAASGIIEEITLGTNLSFTGTTLNATNSGGTVTSFAFTDANGIQGTVTCFAFTVDNGIQGTVTGSTGAVNLTLRTNVTGLVKANGTAFSAAVLNTDYLDPSYTGFDTRYLRLTGASAMTGDLTLANSTPTNALHAASKGYVDSVATSLSWKNAVRAATLVNGTFSTAFAAGQVIDGITLVLNDRILIKNQTTTTENGLFTVNSSGAPTRTADADTASELDSATVMVEYGTQANTQWTETATLTTAPGTQPITFAQIGGAGTYTNGTGILLTTNQFSLDVAYTNTLYVPLGRTIQINGSTFDLSANRTFTITTTGTAGRITVANGGTLTPTIDLASGIATPGTYSSLTVDTYGRVTGGTNPGYITGNQTITLSQDATGSGTTAIAVTLATVNANVGSFGTSTAIPTFTVNAKGLITAAGSVAVIAPAGTLTGATLASNVLASSLTSTGIVTGGTWSANFNAGLHSTAATVSAGASQGTSALSNDYNVVTTATAGQGVTLPAASAGRQITVINRSANTILVYPSSGHLIDNLSANTAVSVPNNGVVVFDAISSTQWYSTVNLVTNAALTTGVVPLINGGTGIAAGSANAAFNALSPMTTAGDIIYGGSAGAGTRLAAGTATQVLIGGTTPSWGAVNLSTMASGTLQAAQMAALTGEVTGTAGSLSITLNNASVIAKVLTAYPATPVGGTVTSSDTIFSAIQKIDGNDAAKLSIAKFIFNETLGIITTAPNGSTVAFSLAATPATPNTSKVAIFINGQKQKNPGDYSISGTTVTFVVAPVTNDVLDANYIQA